MRYYFDFNSGNGVAADEEGMLLPDIEAAQDEAARSLADMAREAMRGLRTDATGHRMAIDVRDDDGPVMQVKFTFEVEPHKR